MPRHLRPGATTRSEHWLRVAVNQQTEDLNRRISSEFGWPEDEGIEWVSPLAGDNYAEYSDNEFLQALGVHELKTQLNSFWPKNGPHWDALARTESGKLLLVEAKAHIDEVVDGESRASDASLAQIVKSLEAAKHAFGANPNAPWNRPFYQYANRLAHLYFLRELNGLDAYLIFLYFANAPDVPHPCTREHWEGAERLLTRALGLGSSGLLTKARTVIWDLGERK